MYTVKILSPANIVEDEIGAETQEELIDVIKTATEDYLDNYPGYTLEVTANL